jgi:hypothetical protein
MLLCPPPPAHAAILIPLVIEACGNASLNGPEPSVYSEAL